MSTPDLHLLAEELASHGFVGHETAVDAVCRAARSAGLSAVLVDVLADRHAPDVARLRSFGMLTAHLGRQPHVPAEGSPRPVVGRPEPALAA